MKKWGLACLLLSLLLKAGAQGKLHAVAVTEGKTTGLVFPAAVVKVDRGTKNILVEPVAEAKNILLVKAASPHFAETNLSVVTADGAFYSFAVGYDSMPAQLVYNVAVEDRLNKEKLSEVNEYARMLLGDRREIHRINDYAGDIEFRMNGIYIKDSTMFFQLQVLNRSSIDYPIDFLRFSIKDKKKGKRTAIQEQELQPLYLAGNTHLVKGNSNNNIVVALPAFTLAGGKEFIIELNERNGGRHLKLYIPSRKLIKASILSPID